MFFIRTLVRTVHICSFAISVNPAQSQAGYMSSRNTRQNFKLLTDLFFFVQKIVSLIWLSQVCIGFSSDNSCVQNFQMSKVQEKALDFHMVLFVCLLFFSVKCILRRQTHWDHFLSVSQSICLMCVGLLKEVRCVAPLEH